MQGRGLKLVNIPISFTPKRVAPYAGAWIETFYVRTNIATTASPLMQGRGLKQSSVIP